MTRTHLPNRRPSFGLNFTHGGIVYHGSASFGPGDKIFEIFLSGGKVGSEVEAIARDAAVITALALQYGAPLEVLRGAITRLDNGEPAGPTGCLLDEISKEMNQ